MLHVIIAGAGIAGLTTAIALRRAGHRVDVYERSSLNNELGAAIHVPPNAARFLLSWGLKPSDWGFVTSQSITFQDSQTLEVTEKEYNPASAAGDGIPLYLAHRVDLHSALKDMATQVDGPGEPVKLHKKSDVASFDPSAPSMTLRDGTTIHADIIVGADGVHSVAAEAVLGRKNKPVKPAHANFCYRFLIPSDVLGADPDTRFYNEEMEGQTRLITHQDGTRRIVSYMCRSNTIHNFVCMFDDADMDATHEDWQTAVDVHCILNRFSDFHPSLLKVVAKATAAKQFPLLYREPIERWTRDYLVLAGDSAHPMLPHQAQGGAQSMEDGVALGIALCGATSKEDARERLQIYEQLRMSRASVIQILSNVGMDQLELVRDEAAKYLPEDAIPSNGAEIRKFSYSYDVVKAAIQATTRHDPAFALPVDFFDGSCKGPYLERVVSASAKI